MNDRAMKQATVLHLCGWSGTGKTTLLERFAKDNPGSIQILSPTAMGEAFDPSSADLRAHAAVALDEVMMWARESVAVGVATLEREALAAGKHLILVTQGRNDLEAAGVRLATEPVVVQLNGRQESLDIWFDGQALHKP